MKRNLAACGPLGGSTHESSFFPHFSPKWNPGNRLKDRRAGPFPVLVVQYLGSANIWPKALFFGWLGAITATTTDAMADTATAEQSSTTAVPVVTGSGSGNDQIPTWREGLVRLTIDPSFSALPNARFALEQALLAWTSSVSELPQVELVDSTTDGASLSAEENNTDHRISFAASGTAQANGALAITLIAVNGDAESIVDADIIVNGAHHFALFDAHGTPATASALAPQVASAPLYDLQDVLTHELGHWFGLRENYANKLSTMYAYVEPSEVSKRDLDLEDVDTAQLAYWRADNPGLNTGCALSKRTTSDSGDSFGSLAAALFLLIRPNRQRITHVLAKARRLVTVTPQTRCLRER
jgi:hypothetical protein